MSVKRPADGSAPKDVLQFTNLGAGAEVGRSCHIIQFKGKTIMLDAGVHPAYSGQASLPFYDEFDLSEVDILLISHFHLDHAASLPHVMQKTNFKGRVFMTHPTKAIYKWLMSDFVRVSSATSGSGEVDQLYSEAELAKSFESIEAVDYHSTTVVNGIKFTAYHAGHVLGGAMYFIEIAGVKILFTGDYSREQDRHLNIAEVPPEKPDILITESTYGTATHQSRVEKEARLTNLISKAVLRGGRVLMPVFALGRAQEILLILDEYWSNHPELQHVPIYYISALAKKCMAVFQTYIYTMNDAIQAEFQHHNPFIFKHIASIRSLDRFDDIGPSVMLASPGMLQNGNSRALLERWAPDQKNLLMVTGYSVEGTMAKHIMNEPTEITSVMGQGGGASNVRIPRRMAVEELSFAAHVDFTQNRDFIDAVDAKHIILVHGEALNMGKLKSALLSKYSPLRGTDQEKHVWNPKNCDTLELEFVSVKIAKVVGQLATQHLSVDDKPASDLIAGILVQRDFEYKLMAPQDLQEESGIGSTTLVQRQKLRYHAGPDLVEHHLKQMFGAVKRLPLSKKEKADAEQAATTASKKTSGKLTGVVEKLGVMDLVTVMIDTITKRLTVEWAGGSLSDAVADAVLCILAGIESSPVSVKLSSKACNHGHAKDEDEKHDVLGYGHAGLTVDQRKERIRMFVRQQFGSCDDTDNGISVEVDGKVATVPWHDLTAVDCPSAALKARLQGILKGAVDTIAPFAEEQEAITKEGYERQAQKA
ncbi:beta-lactamase-like protein [Protomyces lactucae-debilis]|uniref:Endoribonuclease YSH1 n=1 Tax=Protomyces lactucae-debilis TaxID=2754530 RepID=A0A1Y2FTT3_PROLT|nr:beta-lactamase-like protein [Protomyces lactucae-debilis]ORY86977.1 beta-lactamase-like protein [Protomyces lactucae-debilis]